MAMCMEHTKTMRFGPCVTNPNTRDWSLAASMFGSLAKQSGAGSTSASGAATARCA
jgi:alkanesulfonate monooxygenase SsuD/methylene tetrahydromethanopterin reductase-like flavin-dependent oxidoreductase (luciferase family)